MTQEDKDLLLKDLSGRVPYGVKASYYGAEEECETWDEIEGITIDGYVDIGQYSLPIEGIKPYLFPLSSMTEEQENEWYEIHIQPLLERLKARTRKEDLMLNAKSLYVGVDYLIANHFDYRGLIPMGLAIDCTNLNIY